MDKLLPCPFCGGNAAVINEMSTDREYEKVTIGCDICDIYLPYKPTEVWVLDTGFVDIRDIAKKELSNAWNKRVK